MAEAADLKSVQCGFESLLRDQYGDLRCFGPCNHSWDWQFTDMFFFNVPIIQTDGDVYRIKEVLEQPRYNWFFTL